MSIVDQMETVEPQTLPKHYRNVAMKGGGGSKVPAKAQGTGAGVFCAQPRIKILGFLIPDRKRLKQR
jgi:hypothetical protein